MGNSEKMDNDTLIKNLKTIKDVIENEFRDILDSKNKIIYYIDDSFNKLGYQNIPSIYNWKNNIIYYINYIFDGKDRNIENILTNMGVYSKIPSKENLKQEEKKEVNELLLKEKNSKLEVITARDIQNKLFDITREFEKISVNFINDDDDLENKTLGEYLLDIANISRYSYNESNKFLNILFQEFEKSKKKETILISSADEFKLRFSQWIKNDKNQNIIKAKLEGYLSNKAINFIKKMKEKNYIIKLFRELLVLFYQCELSFPPINIKYLSEKEKDFNSKAMIDLFDQKIGKKKVNFDFFPSFECKGSFLENGKNWVFTYKEGKTFNFKVPELVKIEEKKFLIPNLKDKLCFEIVEEKYLVPKINFELIENLNYEYHFYLQKKKNNSIEIKKSNSPIIIQENEKFQKCDFILMGECIATFPFPKDNK